jgi:superfamily II DNA or RNA helicase
MTFELRPYQQDLADRASASALAGRRPVLCAATGSGKSVILAEIARRAVERGEKVILTAHRLEIVKQLMASIAGHLGETPQIITRHHTTPMRDVCVAMAPTLIRRPRWIEKLQGRVYLCDEAHHVPAKSFQKLLQQLNPLRFIGATATPIHANGGGLAPHFDDLLLGPEISWLMEQGYLAKYKLYGTMVEVDTSGLSTRGGDYALDQLEERVVKINGNILRDWHLHNPQGRPTICVGVSIAHGQSVNRLFNDAGIPASYVDGSTPQVERDRIFDDFRAGRIKVLCSVCLIDEGIDICEAACLHLLRPTKSIRLYRQLIGRVLRPKADGSEAIIIDASGSWRDLPLPDEHIPWTLDAKIKSPRAEDRQVTRDPDDYTVAKRKSIQEDNVHLQLVSTTASIEAKRQEARRRLRKTIRLIERGVIPERALWNHLKDARYYSDVELLAIQQTLDLPHNWAETQGWLNA